MPAHDPTPPRHDRRQVGWLELDHVPVDDDLAGILEIHGDAMPGNRLDLAKTPVRLVGVAHEVSGRK